MRHTWPHTCLSTTHRAYGRTTITWYRSRNAVYIYYGIEWNWPHRNRNWNWIVFGIWYRIRNRSVIAFIGIGIALQKRIWAQLCCRTAVYANMSEFQGLVWLERGSVCWSTRGGQRAGSACWRVGHRCVRRRCTSGRRGRGTSRSSRWSMNSRNPAKARSIPSFLWYQSRYQNCDYKTSW